MSPAALLILKYLIRAEPLITLGVMLAWIRAGKKNSGLRTMRDYLAFRSVDALVSILLLYYQAPPSYSIRRETIYIYSYWAGFLVLAWLMLRVAGELVQRSLHALPGLEALAKTIFRWVLAASALVAIPVAIGAARFFLISGKAWAEYFRFLAGISIAQLLPLLFAIAVVLCAGFKWRRRNVGILIAFCLEPASMLTTSWFQVQGLAVWTNLVLEIVCYAALALWTWYAFHPDREDQLPTPNTTLQRWDQMARKALRHRLPPAEEPGPDLLGARPKPRPND